MNRPVRALLLFLTLLAVGLTAWPALDPCEHGDPCCQDDCSPDCAAFCCAGIVGVPATVEMATVLLDLREAPCFVSLVVVERFLEPPFRPPTTA